LAETSTAASMRKKLVMEASCTPRAELSDGTT
jgi:hypothetical protein